MATYHCTVKKGKVGYGGKHSDYILREGKYSKSEKAEELVYKSCGNLPQWAESPHDFWKAADIYERANSNVYYEFEIALPNELSLEDNIKIVEKMIENHIGDNKAYSYAIHNKFAALADGKIEQPHVHLMFCERQNDGILRDKDKYFARANKKNPEKGGNIKDNRFTENFYAGSKNIVTIRKACEEYINDAYKKNGLDCRISSDSLKEQRTKAILENDFEKAERLDRMPENHLGPKIANQTVKEIKKIDIKDENYFIKFASEKARKAFLYRSIKQAKIEKLLLVNEIEKLENALDNNTNKISLISDLKELNNNNIGIFNANYKEVANNFVISKDKKISTNEDKIKLLKAKIITKENINLIAKSLYTKGEYKRLYKEYNKTFLKLKNLETKINNISKLTLKNVSLNIENDKKECLVLSEKYEKLKNKLNKSNLEINTNGKKQIQKFVDKLNSRNLIFEEKINKLISENLKNERQIEYFNKSVEQLPSNNITPEPYAYGAEYVKIIDYHINNLKYQINHNSKMIKSLKRSIILEPRLIMIAQSVYSKGQSKIIMKEYNQLLKERDILNKKIAEFNKKEMPPVWKINDRSKYNKLKEELNNSDHSLSVKENNNKEKIKYLKEKMSIPVAQERISKMVKSLKDKNSIKQERLSLYELQNDKISQQIEKLIKIKKEFNSELRNYVINNNYMISTGQQVEQVINNCSNAINQLKTAIAKSQADKVKGALRAKLNQNSKENENEID